ncbi:MAG: potassium transporter [Desulfatirhabdiaceae bacterium]|nr:potassium transporter [Desulfatirhabdiaceae bacterium]
MKHIWIIGAGRFGKKAVSAIKKRHPESFITVVDHCPKACEAISGPGLTTVCMDGVSYLHHYLTDAERPVWVIPVIPVHLVYEWIRLRLLPDISTAPVDIPECFRRSLPNVFPGNTGEIFVSNATFVCPENCSEPRDLCTNTRMPRKQSLYQAIAALSCNGFLNLVLQSEQLAPGIGGIRPLALFDTLSAVQQFPESILLSTACRCHGVVQAFRKIITER